MSDADILNHVLHEERHIGNFSGFINKKDSSDNPARATPYSTESQKSQKPTKQNTMNRAPPTRTWGQSIIHFLDAAPLCRNQGEVSEQMAAGEGGGDGACRTIFLCSEEGKSRDRRIHHAS